MKIDNDLIIEILKQKSPIFFTGAMYDDICVDCVINGDTIVIQYYLKKNNVSIDHSIDTIPLEIYKGIHREIKLKKALN